MLLLATSVVRHLFFRPVVELAGPTLAASDPSPTDLARCQRDVAGLFDSLDQTAVEIVARPGRVGDREVLGSFEAFSRGWLRQWDEVNAFCRFSELADTNLGATYDRMAEIHGDLAVMRLKYQSMLARFDDEQASELVRLRTEIAEVRRALERTGPTPSPRPETPAP